MTDTPRTEPLDPVAVMRQISTAFAPIVEHRKKVFSQMVTALQPLSEYVQQHPEALFRWEAERAAEEHLGSCHCLCATHRDQAVGVCTSVAGLSVHFESPSVGPCDVPMCRPCYQARQLVAA